MTAQAVGFPLLVLPRGAVMAWTDQQVIYSGDVTLVTDERLNARREAMVDWLAQHGIDARHVPVPGWIVRDETNRCVVYWGSHDCREICANEACLQSPTCRRVMVEQLEAPPLPFPLPWTPDPAPVAQYEAWSP